MNDNKEKLLKKLKEIIEVQDKQIDLIKDTIKDAKILFKVIDELNRRKGKKTYYGEDRPYVCCLLRILKIIKETVENNEEVPDVYFYEVEADVASIYLWKEAKREEVIEIIKSFGNYNLVADHISPRLLTDDNIY
jgi:hypothetical protein